MIKPLLPLVALLAAPLVESPAWRSSLRRLLVDFARDSDAVVATAEVVRGVHWSGRALSYDMNTERAIPLWTRTGWAGLSPYPIWLTWFGTEYAPLVADHLDPGRTERVGDGLVYCASAVPLDRDALTPTEPQQSHGLVGRLLRRGGRGEGERSAERQGPHNRVFRRDSHGPTVFLNS